MSTSSDGSRIIKCTCKHSAQDRLHGPGKRVGNLIRKGNDEGKYRCTVCGKVREK